MDPAQLEATILGFGALLTESRDFHRDAHHNEVPDVFSEAMALNYSLHRRLTIGSKRYVVAFVGLSNVGKSTLLDALLGNELTPRRNSQCTSAPIEFERGRSLELRSVDGSSFLNPAPIPCKDVESVHEHLQRLATHGTSKRRLQKRAQKITVSVPAPYMEPLLDSGMVVADTPGFGSASTDGSADADEAKLRDYIAREVAQVFWITLAEQGITDREATFYNNNLKSLCDDIIVTGAEDWDLKDRTRFQDRFSEFVLGGRLTRRFHFVSGKLGLTARLNPNPAVRAKDLEEHGIAGLEKRLLEVSGSSRVVLIEEEFRALAFDLHRWLVQFQDSVGRPLKYRYAPDSLQRWRHTQCGNFNFT